MSEIALSLPAATPVPEPAAPVEGAPAAEETPAAEPVVVDKDAAELKAIAKFSREARLAKQRADQLEADLAAAKAENTPEKKRAAIVEALKSKDARKLLKEAGIGLDEAVAFFESDEADEDPTIDRVAALEKKVDDANKAREDDALKAANAEAEAAKANNARLVKSLIDAANSKSDVAKRWPLVAKDSTAIDVALDEVAKFVIEKKIATTITSEQSQSLIEQALDQIEASHRADLEPLLGELAPRTDSQNPRNIEKQQIGRAETPRTQTIDSSVRGSMPTQTTTQPFSSGRRQIGMPVGR